MGHDLLLMPAGGQVLAVRPPRAVRGRALSVAVGALTAAVVGLVGLGAPGVAGASVTIGSDLSAANDTGVGCPGATATCTESQTAIPGRQVTSPTDGTVVRWRANGNNALGASLTFRVLRPAGGAFTGAGASAATPVPAGIQTFSVTLPIHAGDVIGVDQTNAGTEAPFHHTGVPSTFTIAEFGPKLGASETRVPDISGSTFELLVNADVAALPTSTASIPACSQTGAIPASVASDPDPAVAPKALHVRIDAGAEQALATTGNPGSVAVAVPNGTHSLEFWGEDTVGGLESPHHTATVRVDTASPTVTITSDQGKNTYTVGEPASVTVRATDLDGFLAANPNANNQPISTALPGTFTITRTATDNCGNTTTASFTYTVTAPPVFPPVFPPVASAAISGLSLNPTAFLAAPAGPSIARKRTGTTVSYLDSRTATTTFTVQRPVKGIRHGKRCVKPNRNRRRHAKRCARYLNAGSFTHRDRAGPNKFHFTGRINRRKLRPGRYRLRATPQTPGTKPGRTAYTNFKIKRP